MNFSSGVAALILIPSLVAGQGVVSSADVEVIVEEPKCTLTGQLPQKPYPSLQHCYFNNINACCLTAHDELIAGQFGDLLPEACLGEFPDFEFFQCFGCHFSEPTVHGSYDQKTRKTQIKLCKNFVQRLYGQEELNQPTETFDHCGFFHESQKIIRPSALWSNAEDFLNDPMVKPKFMDDFVFVITDDTESIATCFNEAYQISFGLLTTLFAVNFYL